MPTEKILNVPNILSFYRLLSFPFVLWMIAANEENLFALFLCINLITDILDGLIARLFKLQTAFGARLDSLADLGTYILAVVGLVKFKSTEIGDSIYMMWLMVAMLLVGYVVSLLKFRKIQSFHLYSTKIGGYVQGIFFFILFTWGYNAPLYYTAMIIGVLSCFEEVVILLVINHLESNLKSVFKVLKNGKN